jgi:hypothetical protein
VHVDRFSRSTEQRRRLLQLSRPTKPLNPHYPLPISSPLTPYPGPAYHPPWPSLNTLQIALHPGHEDESRLPARLRIGVPLKGNISRLRNRFPRPPQYGHVSLLTIGRPRAPRRWRTTSQTHLYACWSASIHDHRVDPSSTVQVARRCQDQCYHDQHILQRSIASTHRPGTP